MGKSKLQVGFITTVSGRWPRELPKQRHEQYGKWIIENIEEVELIAAPSIVVNNQEVEEMTAELKRQAVDIVVVVIGAFTGDFACTYVAEQLKVPVILWAPYEPPFDGGRIMANSLVAATMNAAALKRLRFPYHFVYGGCEEPRVQKEIKQYLKTYQVIKQLKNTFMGLIGYRPTGFYSSTFDETLSRKTFGVKMEEFDLVAVFNKAKEIDEKLVTADIEYLRQSMTLKDLPEEYLENHSRLKLAFDAFIKEQGFDVLSLKCWPELGNMKCTPCAIISRLADEGVVIGCESDVDATLTMMIQKYFTNKTPFMADLIQVDEKENTALFWHCGQAAKKLKDPKSKWIMGDHPLAGQGAAFGGTLKPGRVTISLMTRQESGYKLFLAKGEAIPTEPVVTGVMVNVRLDAPVLKTIYTIAEEGVPHHYSIIWEDIEEAMKLFAEVLDIDVIEVKE